MMLGMSTDGDSKDIPDEYCREMQNMECSPQQAVSVRKGFVKVNTASLGAPIRGLFGYKPRFSSTTVIVAANGTDIETI